MRRDVDEAGPPVPVTPLLLPRPPVTTLRCSKCSHGAKLRSESAQPNGEAGLLDQTLSLLQEMLATRATNKVPQDD